MKTYRKDIRSFTDLQAYLDKLYRQVNSERSWDYSYGYLVRACGFMSVNAAKGGASPEHFVRALSWLFAIGSKVDVRVTEAYVRRFPEICYYCVSAPCVCHKTGKQPSRPMAAYKVLEEREGAYQVLVHEMEDKDLVIDYTWIRNNISKIYPNNGVFRHSSG